MGEGAKIKANKLQRSVRLKVIVFVVCLVISFMTLVPLDTLTEIGSTPIDEDENHEPVVFSRSNTAVSTMSSTTSNYGDPLRWIPKTRTRRCPAKTKAEIQKHRKSQQKEDLELLVSFQGFCDGTYIEMGALNGVRYSNSFLFQKQFGYQGLLVELSPPYYKLAVRNRPNELAVVNAAV